MKAEKENYELERSQKEIMKEFYSFPRTKVIFNKIQRDHLWELATKREKLDFAHLSTTCPALEHQIQKSYESGKNIQSAVFSECVYAQTLANIFNLPLFVNCSENKDFISPKIKPFLENYNLVPRYVYSREDKRRMLIQAGSCEGIDSALITVVDEVILYTIEFKEPGAKIGEHDLPKYDDNGIWNKDDKWEKWKKKYPQFSLMLEEQKDLNFFEYLGHNIHDFSPKSVTHAVIHNYIGKFLDVICTEDIEDYLVMIPAHLVYLWANTEGEIRTAGRNHCKVWTPAALTRLMIQYAPEIDGATVKLEKSKLDVRTERGGDGKISGYKIAKLFFIYVKDCKDDGKYITFNLMKVRQLKPTIAGKIFFKTLKYEEVKSYYQKLF